MKIWLITVGEPLPVVDGATPRLMRTGTLASLLAERGHEVLWWTSAFDHYKKRHRAVTDSSFRWSGGTVRMLRSVGYKSNLSLRRFLEHAGIARKFRKEATELSPPDVILVSLPTIELAREAVRYGRRCGVPVLVDVRDLWPDLLIEVAPAPLKGAAALVLSSLVRAASFALRECTGIIGISDGYLDWGLRYAGRSRGKIDAVFPLGYVAAKPVDDGNRQAIAGKMAALGVDSSKKICWFVGSFGKQYDLAPVLDAAARFQKEGRRDVQFVISGEGEYGQRWRTLAQGVGNVIFTGWIDADEINWLRGQSQIGLQPYLAGAPQGLANKLFEYLSAGIPVISSLRGENEVLIEQHRCGLNYRAGDGSDCFEKIAIMVSNDEQRLAMGRRGKALFESQFDSKLIFQGLIAHLESVADKN